MTTKTLKRATYEQRSRSNTQAARVLAAAFSAEVQFIETKDGDRIRQWRQEELRSFKLSDIAKAISRRRAFEYNELLEQIPPTAIKEAVSKRWLLPANGLYFVTDKAAAEFDLPRKTFDGLTIRFVKAAA